MLTYLADLMEDASDFAWANAKAAHAVMLYGMERGLLNWTDVNRLDRLRRAHAQKHAYSVKSNSKNDVMRKPWLCKAYQQGTCQYEKEHEFNKKIQKHICAFCFSHRRQLAHPERDCHFKKKQSKKRRCVQQKTTVMQLVWGSVNIASTHKVSEKSDISCTSKSRVSQNADAEESIRTSGLNNACN